MTVFEFENYKDFVLKKLANLPLKGHGQFSKIANKLNIHTSLVSQIFNGPKHLTFEQACDLCTFFGMTELESDYLIALVLKERAGTSSAKAKCERDLAILKGKSQILNERVKTDVVLSDADSAIFYSHWYYAAVKIMISLIGKNTPEQMASYLNIPLVKVNEILEFLVQTGLCVLRENTYQQGPSKIHIGAGSPFVSRHHLNWRIKAIEKVGNIEKNDFSFTMPANLSFKDAKVLRQLLLESAQKCISTVDDSKAETMYCLNIDWFKVVKDN